MSAMNYGRQRLLFGMPSASKLVVETWRPSRIGTPNEASSTVLLSANEKCVVAGGRIEQGLFRSSRK